MATQVTNVSKAFGFAIEINGVNQFYIQEVKKPEVEIGASTHGGTNYDVKTAGGVKVSDAELKLVKSTESTEDFAWTWLHRAQDMASGSGGTPDEYYQDVIFKELAEDMTTTIRAELWEGAWARKCSDDNYKRGAIDDNMIQTVTISVNKVIKLK